MDQNKLPTNIHTSSSSPRAGDGAVSLLGVSILTASFEEDYRHQDNGGGVGAPTLWQDNQHFGGKAVIYLLYFFGDEIFSLW